MKPFEETLMAYAASGELWTTEALAEEFGVSRHVVTYVRQCLLKMGMLRAHLRGLVLTPKGAGWVRSRGMTVVKSKHYVPRKEKEVLNGMEAMQKRSTQLATH